MSEWETEVRRLHTFFEDWFRGALPPEAFPSFADALDPAFVLVDPSGARHDREATRAAVRDRRGSGALEIRIEAPSLIVEKPLSVGTYEEWQRPEGGAWRGRISLAVMAPDPTSPCGFRWLAVHETWLVASRP